MHYFTIYYFTYEFIQIKYLFMYWTREKYCVWNIIIDRCYKRKKVEQLHLYILFLIITHKHLAHISTYICAHAKYILCAFGWSSVCQNIYTIDMTINIFRVRSQDKPPIIWINGMLNKHHFYQLVNCIIIFIPNKQPNKRIN